MDKIKKEIMKVTAKENLLSIIRIFYFYWISENEDQSIFLNKNKKFQGHRKKK